MLHSPLAASAHGFVPPLFEKRAERRRSKSASSEEGVKRDSDQSTQEDSPTKRKAVDLLPALEISPSKRQNLVSGMTTPAKGREESKSMGKAPLASPEPKLRGHPYEGCSKASLELLTYEKLSPGRTRSGYFSTGLASQHSFGQSTDGFSVTEVDGFDIDALTLSPTASAFSTDMRAVCREAELTELSLPERRRHGQAEAQRRIEEAIEYNTGEIHLENLNLTHLPGCVIDLGKIVFLQPPSEPSRSPFAHSPRIDEEPSADASPFSSLSISQSRPSTSARFSLGRSPSMGNNNLTPSRHPIMPVHRVQSMSAYELINSLGSPSSLHSSGMNQSPNAASPRSPGNGSPMHSRPRRIFKRESSSDAIDGIRLLCGSEHSLIASASLEANEISRLPSGLFFAKNLTVLSLRNNRLKELPRCIDQLTKLRELHIQHNYLNYLPASILGMTELKVLALPNPFYQYPESQPLSNGKRLGPIVPYRLRARGYQLNDFKRMASLEESHRVRLCIPSMRELCVRALLERQGEVLLISELVPFLNINSVLEAQKQIRGLPADVVHAIRASKRMPSLAEEDASHNPVWGQVRAEQLEWISGIPYARVIDS